MWLLWILLVLVLFFLLIFHVVTYSVRWLVESRRTGDERTILEFTLRDNVLPVLAEMVCQFSFLLLWATDLLLSLRHIRLSRRKTQTAHEAKMQSPGKQRKTSGAERPIVFVHGLGMRGLTMFPIAWRFRRAGRAVHLFTYWPPGMRIEVYARQLHDFIERLCEETGWEELDGLGHSMGGLVIRQYLAADGGARRMKRVVTVGTPHQGTELWRFAPSGAARQLMPNSEFLRELDQAGLPPGIEATAIVSDHDGLIIPNANARWEFPGVRNHTISQVGHTRLVFHSETFQIAREALSENSSFEGGAPPSAPSGRAETG